MEGNVLGVNIDEERELLIDSLGDYRAGFERFIDNIPIISTLPLAIRCFTVGALPYLLGLPLAMYTGEVRRFSELWLVSDMTPLISFSFLWTYLMHRWVRKTLPQVLFDITSLGQMRVMEDSLRLMFVSRYQYVPGIVLGVLASVQISLLGFECSALLNYYIYLNVFVACFAVGFGIWFAISSLYMVYRVMSWDMVCRYLYPSEMRIVKWLASMGGTFTLAIAWMEGLFLVPILWGPYASMELARREMRPVWIAIMLLITLSYFMAHQIKLNGFIRREKSQMLESLLRDMRTLFDERKCVDSESMQLFECYQNMYESIRSSSNSALTVVNSAQLLSSLAVVPIVIEVGDFIVNLLSFVHQ